MFDFLKKKLGGFIDGLTKKEEAKQDVAEPPDEKKDATPIQKNEEPAKEIAKKPIKIEKEKKVEKPIEKIVEEPVKYTLDIESSFESPNKIENAPEKPKERVKLGIVSSVKSIISREVRITEGDVKGMLDDLELELLEADVELSVAESIKQDLFAKLVGSKIAKEQLHLFVGQLIKSSLIQILSNDKGFDIVEKLESSEKPLKVMFLGINGAGKTTTIAKVARLMQENRRKVVIAAADTFRAAAIEQMEVHANRLGIKMIKRDYGSDPTSVAFDAVNYAKAHGIDAVLIDTAGRQDTNISLINEMKKMNRIIQPDIKIYIGESIAGNAIIEQISAFNREIGIDAVILTKLDCDPKGGTMLSINKATGVPIIYVGVGQSYEDLEKFDPKTMVERIVE